MAICEKRSEPHPRLLQEEAEATQGVSRVNCLKVMMMSPAIWSGPSVWCVWASRLPPPNNLAHSATVAMYVPNNLAPDDGLNQPTNQLTTHANAEPEYVSC